MTARDVIAERLAMLEGSERPWHWHNQKAEAILEALVVASHSVRQELAALLNPGYAIVPIKLTERMLEELSHIDDGPWISGAEVWGYMLAAATAALPAPPSEDKM